MRGDIPLSNLIDVLKSDWSVINPIKMQDILNRLVVTAEEVPTSYPFLREKICP